MRNKICQFATLIVLLTQTQAGQSQSYEFIRNRYFRPAIHFKSWSFDNAAGVDKFTEMAFPVIYSMPMGPRLGLDVISAPFLSKLKPTAGSDLEFNNVSDTFVRASYIVGDNRALITFGVAIPSGETKLNDEELAVAGIAANRPLDNPVSSFGTGTDISFGLALAHEVGSWVLGFGFGYALRGQYDVVFNSLDGKIDPGDELNLTLGIEREFESDNGNTKFTADFVYTNYSEDDYSDVDFAGEPLFYEAGDKIVVRGQLITPLGFLNPAIFSVTNRLRLDNKANNALLIENGNELEFRATLIQPTSESFTLRYILTSKIFSNTINDAEGALIFGFGGGFSVHFSDRVKFDPAAVFSIGSINTGPNEQIDVTGIEITGGLSFTL